MDERLEAPEYLSGLRRLHQPDKGGRCPQCGPGEGRWPCTVAALLEHIDAQDAELARLRAPVTDELREIGERHTESVSGRRRCRWCQQDWPCDAARLWAALAGEVSTDCRKVET